jgi:hypothetical protein
MEDTNQDARPGDSVLARLRVAEDPSQELE